MRKLIIDEADLGRVLKAKSMYIGGSFVSAISLLVGGIHELNEYPGSSWISWCLVGLGGLMIVVAGWEVFKSVMYNHKKLGKEIIDLDQTAHHHSIIAIKDTFEVYPNRFLVYQDEAWHCRFFLNYPTQVEEMRNQDFIAQKISGALKVPMGDIILTRKAQVMQQKYSERHKEMRVYDHVFYEAKISHFPKTLQESSFTIDGVTYYWMTLEEMKLDADIQEKNLDVVKEVEKQM